ncbi:hypothetical protein NT6N_22640 [Oceaniferula spumae]|uniref:Uncharacterized protein n=1 Tax=Oceaniferula spumae TaxID=2979115 RepID=A0AAT9FMJ1_9BACT
MQTTPEQIMLEAKACDDIKVEQARRMSLQEKFLAGADLFEEACRWTMIGIKNQFPDYTEEEQKAELRRRLDLMR